MNAKAPSNADQQRLELGLANDVQQRLELGPIERPRPVARWQNFTGQEAVRDGALN